MAIRVTNDIPKVKKWLERQANLRKNVIAKLVLDNILLSFEGPKSGRIYRVPGTTDEFYQASAAGEAPAIASGDLRDDWGIYPENLAQQRNRQVVIGSTLPYAKYLEDGTKFMEARPYVVVTVKALEARIRRILEKPMVYPNN